MAEESGSLRGRRVLILEDEPMIALDLSFGFEDQGAEVVTAASCKIAHLAIEEAMPDLAVLDVNLGGTETCEAVAATLREAGVPFLVHSGDLKRSGEVIERLAAPTIGKPAPASRVVAAAATLLVGG